MSFWVREAAGWLLIAVGLYIIFVCIDILMTPQPKLLQSGPLSIMGIFVFRGGIHLLKVSIAARVAMKAQKMAQQEDWHGRSAARIPVDSRWR